MNKVMLIGRLTRDAELIQLEHSKRGAIRFTLAVDRDFLTKDGQREADFIQIAYWSNHSSKLCPHLTKGKLIGISGKITTGNYINKNGDKKYFTLVQADNIKFLENKKKEDAV